GAVDGGGEPQVPIEIDLLGTQRTAVKLPVQADGRQHRHLHVLDQAREVGNVLLAFVVHGRAPLKILPMRPFLLPRQRECCAGQPPRSRQACMASSNERSRATWSNTLAVSSSSSG